MEIPNANIKFADHGLRIHCGAGAAALAWSRPIKLYVEHMVGNLPGEVWRVLRDDGTLWLNMGDCYSTYRAGWTADRYKTEGWDHTFRDKPFDTFKSHDGSGGQRGKGSKHDLRKGSNRAQRGDSNDGVSYGPRWQPNRQPQPGLKFKDLAGMPWRVAFALQDDGWYLRTDIVWHKKNPMPESVYDRRKKKKKKQKKTQNPTPIFPVLQVRQHAVVAPR